MRTMKKIGQREENAKNFLRENPAVQDEIEVDQWILST